MTRSNTMPWFPFGEFIFGGQDQDWRDLQGSFLYGPYFQLTSMMVWFGEFCSELSSIIGLSWWICRIDVSSQQYIIIIDNPNVPTWHLYKIWTLLVQICVQNSNRGQDPADLPPWPLPRWSSPWPPCRLELWKHPLVLGFLHHFPGLPGFGTSLSVVSVGNYIPNIWVMLLMFKQDIYQKNLFSPHFFGFRLWPFGEKSKKALWDEILRIYWQHLWC